MALRWETGAGGPPVGTVAPPPCPSSSASGLDVRSSSRRSRLRPGLLGLFTFGGSKLRATRSGVHLEGATRHDRLCLRPGESAPIVEPPASRCGPRAGAASESRSPRAGPDEDPNPGLRVPGHKPSQSAPVRSGPAPSVPAPRLVDSSIRRSVSAFPLRLPIPPWSESKGLVRPE